ncbi:Basic leucine zipper 2 [Sesamum angolense]|uniref:Basic leucine zipper 2 n=1 Tax=Sesamum angolense TaxID=2727404 RepID=A0AAE1WS15_9LAMI|nr:Basic leucine zipper 2 [Sesamum angolense]
MFSDDVPATRSSSNPSTPSDQNSTEIHEKKSSPEHHRLQPKAEPGEVDSSCKPAAEASTPPEAKSSDNTPAGDTIVDPKRIKRSRVRKLQYISELERSVTTLQTEVSALSPKSRIFDHQRLLLNVDNSALKQRIAALAQDKIFKDVRLASYDQENLDSEILCIQSHVHKVVKKMLVNLPHFPNHDFSSGSPFLEDHDQYPFAPK